MNFYSANLEMNFRYEISRCQLTLPQFLTLTLGVHQFLFLQRDYTQIHLWTDKEPHATTAGVKTTQHKKLKVKFVKK